MVVPIELAGDRQDMAVYVRGRVSKRGTTH